MSNGAAALAEQQAQGGIETILAKFDTHYVWNYGVSKQALRDLYEKAKREQWNGSTQLAWDTSVDPERGILPEDMNPLKEYAPYQKLDDKQKVRLRHGQVALQLSREPYSAAFATAQLLQRSPSRRGGIEPQALKHCVHPRCDRVAALALEALEVTPISLERCRIMRAGQRVGLLGE